MKKKIIAILLGMSIVGSLCACSIKDIEAVTEKVSQSAVAEAVSTAASEGTTGEYSELTIKTDWESKAEIVFSDNGMTIDGTGAENESGVLCITEGGAYTLSGSSNNVSIVVNTEENVKLILNGVELTSTNGPVIYGAQVKNLYLELAEGTTNTLTDSNSYATDSSTGEEIGKGVISCEDDIIILGEGTLNINGNHKHGITSDDKLYIESGTINIVSEGTDGINANDLVCIDGGVISIEATSDLIECNDMLVINGGSITGNSDDEGIESKNAIYINGGDIDITAVDDAINSAYYIEINGGTINVVSTAGDAIDCNGGYDGCITINGGEINATGAQIPEGALDADQASIIINGGTVTASGGTNSPVIQNGGEVDITGETNSGMGGGPGGGQGGGPGMNGNGQKPEGEIPSDGEFPADGQPPQMNGKGGGFKQQNIEESEDTL